MNYNATFTQGSNYVKFTITGTGFTLTATPGTSTDSYPRAPVNGIQIVPAGPPPAPFVATAGVPFHVVGIAAAGGNSGYQLLVDTVPTGPVVPVATAEANGAVTLPVPGQTAGPHVLQVQAIGIGAFPPALSAGLSITVTP